MIYIHYLVDGRGVVLQIRNEIVNKIKRREIIADTYNYA